MRGRGYGTNWFPHDASAHNDQRILLVRERYGWLGYGIFWAILEAMYETADGRLYTDVLRALYVRFSVEKDWLLEFIGFCVKAKLFVEADGTVYSERLVDEKMRMVAGELTVTNALVRLPDVLASMSRHATADLIVVDFVQRVRDPGSRENLVAETESVSGAIANFAREFEVPVLLLSQLNRDYKSDKAEPPQTYHMKGSGAIEADAHVIGLLHNPNAKEEQSRSVSVRQPGPARDEERVLFIRKNRNGPVGAVRFVFDKARSMFLEDDFYAE